MKEFTKALAAVMLISVAVFFVGCNPEEPENNDKVPQLETDQVTYITETYAMCGGIMSNDGTSVVTERGICWSKNSNPTIDDYRAPQDMGTMDSWKNFSCYMIDLEPNTTYHVRAYAINGDGVGYGGDVSFSTLPALTVPTGALGGVFTINENGGRAFFAQGNLQFQASTNTWRFADKQYDFIGQDNMNASETYDGWTDLFAWATSNYPHGSTSYHPWNYKDSYSDHAYDAYGSIEYNLYDQTGQADWGYNPISNGGNQEDLWRTLSDIEWCYIFGTRITPSGMRYVVAQVNGIDGIIVFPDNWNASNYALNEVNMNNYSGFDLNVISLTDWNTVFESNGALFLPKAGARGAMEYYTDRGGYWSSSTCNPVSAYSGVTMNETLLLPGLANVRWGGESVRLARNVE